MAGPDHSAPAYSYDLTNVKRQLSDEFSILMQKSGGLLSLVSEASRDYYGDSGKLEWLEDFEGYESDTLDNGGAVVAADTTFVVSNIDRFDTGMVIKFRNYDETMFVTGVDTGSSELTVTRAKNGIAAPTTVADESVIDIVSRPVSELNRENLIGTYEPSTEYNYFETFREDMRFSAKTSQSGVYGFSTGQEYVNYNVMRLMNKLRSRLSRAIVWGEREAGSATASSKMRGVYTWLRQDDTNKADASAADIDADTINDMLESIYQDDTMMGNIVLYMDTFQARKIATFNTDVANRLETVGFDSQDAAGGIYKTRFVGDLQATGMPTIVVDKDAPKGAIMALNLAKIQLVYGPNGQLVEWDAKPNDLPPNAQQRAMIMSASLAIKDHKYSHGLIYNLSKS